jgi:hypothetical protein
MATLGVPWTRLLLLWDVGHARLELPRLHVSAWCLGADGCFCPHLQNFLRKAGGALAGRRVSYLTGLREARELHT